MAKKKMSAKLPPRVFHHTNFHIEQDIRPGSDLSLFEIDRKTDLPNGGSGKER
jgi:hypothetical protein